MLRRWGFEGHPLAPGYLVQGSHAPPQLGTAKMGLFSKELGMLHIAVCAADQRTNWELKIAENYDDPVSFCYHYALIFDYFTFHCGTEGVDSERFKPEMRALLKDCRLPLALTYTGELDGDGPIFTIGQQVHVGLSKRADLVHESRLFKSMGGYQLKTARDECLWFLESHVLRHAAALALLDHLIRKCRRIGQQDRTSVLKVLLVLEAIARVYDSMDAWGRFGFMKPEALGKPPNLAIREVEGLSHAEVSKIGDECLRSAQGRRKVADEKGEFNVILVSAGDRRIEVLKELRAITGLGRKEVKDLLDGAPKLVMEEITKAKAEEIKKRLVEAGASVEVTQRSR